MKMNKEISSDAFMDGFPYTLSESSQWIALAETISGQLALLCNDTEISTIIPNISRLSEDLLDAIAYDFSVDWYDVNGTLEEKRRTIQECILVHRYKGTKYAVETALRSVYENATIVEWFQYSGMPYHFKAYIHDNGSDEAKKKRILAKIKYYKNARSVLDETVFVIDNNAKSRLHIKALICGKIKHLRGIIYDPRIAGISAAADVHAGTKLGGKVKTIYAEVNDGNME
jgi:phage tail protein I|nr:MAG TPA: tail protein [Caudoviricetes sp.]